MIIYTYLLGQLINPAALWMPRVLTAISLFCIALLTGVIAWREYGKKAGIASMFLVLPMLLFPFLAPFAANTEQFMLLPLLGLLVLYLFNRTKGDNRTWFWGGGLSALAVLYKPTALLLILYIFINWIFDLIKEKRAPAVIMQSALSAFIGCAVASALILGYLMGKGAAGALWELVVVYNLVYARSFGLSFSSFLFYLEKFWHYWWVLFIFSAWSLYWRPGRFWFYAGLIVIALLTVFPAPSGLGYYYLLVMPFWAIIIAAGISSIADLIKEKFGWGYASPVLAAAAIMIMLYPIHQQFFLSPAKLTEWVYGTVNPFIESAEVARHVRDLTRPQDRIFVAGSEPQIYYYAQRRSASRFIITYPLNLRTIDREFYQKQAIGELKQNPPRVIVVSRRPYSGLWEPGSPTYFIDYLTKTLNERYQLVGGIVWKEGDRYIWQDIIGGEDLPAVSFLVFKRNG